MMCLVLSSAWEWTNSCYERLLERCQTDVLAVRNIRHDVSRYTVYYEPCRHRQHGSHRHSRHLFTLLQSFSITPSCLTNVSSCSLHFFLHIKQLLRTACLRLCTAVLLSSSTWNLLRTSSRAQSDCALFSFRQHIAYA